MKRRQKPGSPGTEIYRMYYTFCEDEGCGAINDYADSLTEAERNRRRHEASHRSENPEVLAAARRRQT